MTMQFAMKDGTSINVEVSGNGKAVRPPIIFVNPLGMTTAFWDGQVKAFSDRQCIRFDIRGTGKSQPSRSAYEIGLLAADVVEILDGLEIESADFVGLSLGGMVGMALGRLSSRRIRRAILSNTTPHIPLADMWNARIAEASEHGLSEIAVSTLTRWLPERFPLAEPETWQALLEMFRSTPVPGYIGCCTLLRDTDLRADLHKVQLPCRIVAGAADLASPPAIAEAMAAAIPEADLHIIEGSAHLSNIDAPSAFNNAVRGWLDQQV